MPIEIHPVQGLPLVQPGDDVPALLRAALAAMGLAARAGDVLVVAQKIISKAEGRQVALAGVTPGAEAERLAAVTGKDPRLVELILSEAHNVMRAVPGVLIVRHRLGSVLANAGIDASNVEGEDQLLLWPENPDASARRIATAFPGCGVIISDSLGRAWRMGTTGHAIGVAGLDPLLDRRGESDLFGRTLQATVIGRADELAAAASLAIGEGAEGTPAALVRGAAWRRSDDGLASLLRAPELDLFP